MTTISIIRKYIPLTVMLLLTSMISFAQTAAPDATAQPAAPTHNWLITLMVIMIAVLAFAIWGLGQVLVAMSKQVLEKQRKEKSATKIVATVLLMLSSVSGFAQTVPAAPAPTNYGGLSPMLFYMFVIVILVEIVAILFILSGIRRLQAELLPEPVKSEARQSSFAAWWDKIDKKYFTRAVPVAREADVMMDHDYDGIKELDNALPPWWKYGFYFTIVVAVIYLAHFHVMGSGKNPYQEYASEMEYAKKKLDQYNAQNKDNIDEASVPMADAAGLAYAKTQYKEKCLACHGDAGQGGAGPNLTDNYWIHKGSLNDIYQSIKSGYPDKGMQAWNGVYTPKEMSYLASFVKKLEGTNPPNAKAPQGDLYTESAAPVAKDSGSAAKPDTSAASKKAAPDTLKMK